MNAANGGETFELPNSSVTTIEWKDGKFKVLKVGDPSYAEIGEKVAK